MRTFVTGGTGFAGINIVRALALAGENVIALDQRPADPQCWEFLQEFKDRVTFEVGDVMDLERPNAKDRGIIIHRLLDICNHQPNLADRWQNHFASIVTCQL